MESPFLEQVDAPPRRRPPVEQIAGAHDLGDVEAGKLSERILERGEVAVHVGDDPEAGLRLVPSHRSGAAAGARSSQRNASASRCPGGGIGVAGPPLSLRLAARNHNLATLQGNR